MSEKERKELVERTAEKFTRLEEVQKAFVAGYMARAMEEQGNHAKQTA